MQMATGQGREEEGQRPQCGALGLGGGVAANPRGGRPASGLCLRAVPRYRGTSSCSAALTPLAGKQTGKWTSVSVVRGPLLKARPAGCARCTRSGAPGRRASPQPYYHSDNAEV